MSTTRWLQGNWAASFFVSSLTWKKILDSSEVKVLINKTAFCVVKIVTAQSKTYLSRLFFRWIPSGFFFFFQAESLNASVVLILCWFHLLFWSFWTFFVLMRLQCRVGTQPRCLSGKKLLSNFVAFGHSKSQIECHLLRSAKISRSSKNSPPKVSTQKCLFESAAPDYMWAYERSKIPEPTSQERCLF
jgi:hypothetical protein